MANCLLKKLSDIIAKHIIEDADCCMKSVESCDDKLCVKCVDSDGRAKSYSVCVSEVCCEGTDEKKEDAGCCGGDCKD